MVLSVSRRLLPRIQDGEDVLQATFLLLVRKAASIRKRDSVGSWLHGVAHHLALKMKTRDMNREQVERRACTARGQAGMARTDNLELTELLDKALRELPESYRAVIILCCLEGRSQQEAARQLGCPVGTLQSRLARGRKLLQQRLAKRGVAFSTGGVAGLWTTRTSTAALPTRLFGNTLHAALEYASGKSLRSLVSASVVHLVKQGSSSIALACAAWIAAGVLGLGLLAGSAGVSALNDQAGKQISFIFNEQEKNQLHREPTQKSIDVEQPRTDRWGDPLPAGALARLGTVRFRHADEIKDLRFAPDGKTLVSADWHGVHVWDASTGRHLRRFGEPRAQFFSIAISADCRIVAVSMQDGVGDASDVEIWDATTGGLLRVLKAARFVQVELSPDGKLLAVFKLPEENNDSSCRLFDVGTGEERRRLDGYGVVTFSRDSKTLIAALADKSIRFHDAVTGEQIRRLDHTAGPVRSLAIAPDGTTLALVSDRKAVLWDLTSGMHKAQLDGPILFGPVFSPDGKLLVGSDFKATRCWDATTGKALPMRTLPATAVRAMAFAPDGKILVTGGVHKTIQLWDLSTGGQKSLHGAHEGSIHGVAISPDGRICATGGYEKTIRLWDSMSGEETQRLAAHETLTWSVAFGSDGRTVISTGIDDAAGSRTSVALWDVATGRGLRRITEPLISGFPKVSSNGKRLAAQGKDGMVRVWEISTGQEVQKWAAPPFVYIAFSSDGRLVLSYDIDRKIHIWEVETGKELQRLDGHVFGTELSRDDRVRSVAFSPDGKFAAVGGEFYHQIALCEILTGKVTRLNWLAGLTGGASSLTFSPDGHVLASGDSRNGTIHLWELATGQEFQRFLGHNGGVSDMVFSTDSKMLLTGNTDTSALIWDVAGTRTGPQAKPLTTKELATAWDDLADADATRAQKAVRRLLRVPEQTLALLARELSPAQPVDAKRLIRIVTDLDNDQFNVREEALAELEKIGDVAAPGMRKVLAGKPSLELKHRLDSVLGKFASSQRLRTLRAVQTLEQLGTRPSREHLEQLANGASEALLTQESKAAVRRLSTSGSKSD
jgi:RNA polymerase sigma factor (sigma-70 family)